MTQTLFPTDRFASRRTPFYFYDTALLADTLCAIRQAVAADPDYHVHYAVKANANPAVLSQIAQAGLGADCVSGGEIEAALAAGIPAGRIVFAGVGKSDEEIKTALAHDIACFNAESLPELEVISELAVQAGRTARVALRINPDVDAHTHAKITTGRIDNKFGIAMDDMEAAIRVAQSLPNVEYAGLHFHIGSQITDLAPFEALAHRINELQDRLEGAGIATPTINVGGGLGIDYENPDQHPIPDFAAYFATFRTHLRLRRGQQLRFELGRSVVGQCGSLIARVLYVKHAPTRRFLILDAGFTDLIRPAMYGSYHAIENISRPQAPACETYDVVGPICESSDVFGKDRTLPASQRGDLIALRSAGAYGEVMASTYNCRPLPPALFSEDL